MTRPMVDNLRIACAGKLTPSAAVGAVLVDLALTGAVELVDKRLVAAAGAPLPSDPLAAEVHAHLVALGPRKPKDAIHKIQKAHRHLPDVVEDRLAATGVLGEEPRHLRIFRGSRRPSAAAIWEVRNALRPVTDTDVAPMDAVALARLLDGLQRLPAVLPDRAERKELQRAIRRQSQRVLAGTAAGDLVEDTIRATVSATVDATTIAVIDATAACGDAGGGGDGGCGD